MAEPTEAERVKLWHDCRCHPDDGTHECMPAEHRCVYCGATIAPCQCNGCGKFLSSNELHHDETRCEDCR